MAKQITHPKVLDNIKRIRMINTYMIDIINFISDEAEENIPIQLQNLNSIMYCNMIENTERMTKRIENILIEINDIYEIKESENGRTE